MTADVVPQVLRPVWLERDRERSCRSTTEEDGWAWHNLEVGPGPWGCRSTWNGPVLPSWKGAITDQLNSPAKCSSMFMWFCPESRTTTVINSLYGITVSEWLASAPNSQAFRFQVFRFDYVSVRLSGFHFTLTPLPSVLSILCGCGWCWATLQTVG